MNPEGLLLLGQWQKLHFWVELYSKVTIDSVVGAETRNGKGKKIQDHPRRGEILLVDYGSYRPKKSLWSGKSEPSIIQGDTQMWTCRISLLFSYPWLPVLWTSFLLGHIKLHYHSLFHSQTGPVPHVITIFLMQPPKCRDYLHDPSQLPSSRVGLERKDKWSSHAVTYSYREQSFWPWSPSPHKPNHKSNQEEAFSQRN